MRQSGILMHISSLPGPDGIGSLGQEARAFADFLHASGMRLWQVLPVGPTGYGESPYQSSSVFAGNPMLISLTELEKEGLLTRPAGTDADPALRSRWITTRCASTKRRCSARASSSPARSSGTR